MLSPDEEKVLEIGFDAALKPLTEALSNIAGPSSKTIGKLLNAMLCNQMRNVVKVYGRAAEMLNTAGIRLAPVPLKVLKPILDGASVEEDELMQELWSALLANAAAENEEKREVSPAFPDVLRQLSPRDARVLDKLFDVACQKGPGTRPLGSLIEMTEHFPNLSELQLFDAIQNLIHHSLLSSDLVKWNEIGGTSVGHEREYYLSPFGGRFIHACRPPKRKS